MLQLLAMITVNGLCANNLLQVILPSCMANFICQLPETFIDYNEANIISSGLTTSSLTNIRKRSLKNECDIFINGRCFALDSSAKNYEEAQKFCLNNGGKLAEPTSNNELEQIMNSININNDINIWLGINNSKSNGFKNPDSSPGHSCASYARNQEFKVITYVSCDQDETCFGLCEYEKP